MTTDTAAGVPDVGDAETVSVGFYRALRKETDALRKENEALRKRVEDANRDLWMPHHSAPRDGRMFLIKYPRMMNLVCRICFDTVHGYFKDDHGTKGGITHPVFLHEGDMWAEIPAYRAGAKS